MGETYTDGRKKKITGDISDGTFDSILVKFIHRHFEEEF